VVETELKFQIPVESRTAVRDRFATKTARTLELQARYFDTPDRRLAQAGLALRLRREGRQWVQALKGPGTSALHRIEHEVQVDASDGEPGIDISRHAGTPAAKALASALGNGVGLLRVIFETRVLRTLRTVRCEGAVVELAFDVGEVIAGPHRLPLCEIEFELRRGSVDGLLTLATRWVERHRLWLDVRSKAERGARLTQGLSAGPPVPAGDVSISPQTRPDAALRAIVGACLAQVLPNAADIAAGVAGPEHLHQLRVGMRRLRCALHAFGDLSAETDPAWMPTLADLFVRLGSARDRDALAESVFPQLRLAGAPLAELPPEAEGDDPGEVLRGTTCNKLLLELIGFSQATGTCSTGPNETEVPCVVSIVKARLRRMRRRLKEDAAAFETLDDTRRHRVRKRLKRLRYSLEFFACLFSVRSTKRWLERVRPAQDVLGRFNDLAVAELAFRAIIPRDERARFAAEWLSARRAGLIPEARSALLKLAGTTLPLREGLHARARRRGRPPP
jgi:inorganic triphosphatase YgiF